MFNQHNFIFKREGDIIFISYNGDTQQIWRGSQFEAIFSDKLTAFQTVISNETKERHINRILQFYNLPASPYKMMIYKALYDFLKNNISYDIDIFYITTYLYLIKLDAEFLEAFYISDLAIKTQKEVRQKMEDIKKITKEHYNKYGSLLGKIKTYILNN